MVPDARLPHVCGVNTGTSGEVLISVLISLLKTTGPSQTQCDWRWELIEASSECVTTIQVIAARRAVEGNSWYGCDSKGLV